jgi:transcriptional regulator with XRE-family HTH domain
MGKKVRDRRIELKMTQSELAKKVGISRVQISNIERGINKNVRLATIKGLSTALGIPVDEFFYDDGVKFK